MKKCSYAKKYRAISKPKCNKGRGCDACNLKFANKHPGATSSYGLGDQVKLNGRRYENIVTLSLDDAAAVAEAIIGIKGKVLREYTSAERKAMPLQSVMAKYFPDAFMALARHSKKANDKHNPGEPMHWAREKSTDHLECAARHLLTPEVIDVDTGELELVGAFWRCGAALQLLEEKRLVAAGIRPLSGVVPALQDRPWGDTSD